MVGPCTTPSKSKGKKLAINSKELGAERSLSLKNIVIKSEGIYWYTGIHTGIITPVDYNILARGIKVNDEHSAIVESQSWNSYAGKEAFTYMVGTPEEVARMFEE